MPVTQKVLVEACCGSLSEAVVAHQCGVDRIEISCALGVGGLTPTPSVVSTLGQLGTPFSVMIRSSESWMTPNDLEIKTMLADCTWIHGSQAESIVFGSLTPDQRVDIDLARRIQDKAQKPLTFHRIVDYARNYQEALQDLANAEIARVLTSGGKRSASEGKSELAQAIQDYPKIEFLIGGGINASNVVSLVQETRASQVHFSMIRKLEPGYDGIPLTEPDEKKLKEIQSALTQAGY